MLFKSLDLVNLAVSEIHIQVISFLHIFFFSVETWRVFLSGAFRIIQNDCSCFFGILCKFLWFICDAFDSGKRFFGNPRELFGELSVCSWDDEFNIGKQGQMIVLRRSVSEYSLFHESAGLSSWRYFSWLCSHVKFFSTKNWTRDGVFFNTLGLGVLSDTATFSSFTDTGFSLAGNAVSPSTTSSSVRNCEIVVPLHKF